MRREPSPRRPPFSLSRILPARGADSVFNPGQEDGDGDLFGDVCDPFPNDPDNDLALCSSDLGDCQIDLFQCGADLAACDAIRKFEDADGDGEEDSTDACPGTAIGMEVDGNGCSQAEFCSAIDGQARCINGDWKNDEPLGAARDCAVEKQSGLCVPR